MKRRSFLLTPAVASAAFAEQSQSGPSWVTTRPRLYFDAREIERIRRLSASDSEFKRRWAAVLESANRMLDARLIPESEAERGGGQHANYGEPGSQISGMGLTLGLAYHVTGDKRYAEKLRRAMLQYAAYKRWYGQGLDGRVPPWHSELNTARFCYGFGVGYDALREYLPAADRKQIGDAMVRLGILNTLDDWILPDNRIHALDSMGHNWWSVCVAMAGVAALSMLGDDERAPDWLARIQRGFERWFEFKGNVLQNKSPNFDRNGAFYESLGYTNYALSEYLRFRLACSNVFPGRALPRFAALERITEVFVQTLYPASPSFWTPSVGDGSPHQNCSPTVRLLVECGFHHPAAGWYLAKTGAGGQPDTLEFLFKKPVPAPVLPETTPRSAYYPDIGWATLRDSWKDDASLLAVKSGFAWNHAHADAGSFVLYHAGSPLIIDSGTCGYDDPAYSGYYTQSRAHNVILFNGAGEPIEDHLRGVKFPGRLPGYVDGLGVKYVYADATGPMARYFCRNYRHWLWIGGVILVIDDVLSYDPGRVDWLLHYQGRAVVTDNGALIENNRAKAEVRFLYPSKLAVREEEGLADHRPSQKVKYLVFSAESGFRDQKIVTAIIPHPVDDSAGIPAVELTEPRDSSAEAPGIRGAPADRRSISSRPDQVGVRIRHGAEITDVYLNINADGRRMHVNTNNILGGWDTDAYLLALTRPASSAEAAPDTVSRCFVACGSYLRKRGKVVLSSLAKIDAVVRPGRAPEIVVHSQETVDAEILAASRTNSVRVNGEAVPARYDGKRQLAAVRVPASG